MPVAVVVPGGMTMRVCARLVMRPGSTKLSGTPAVLPLMCSLMAPASWLPAGFTRRSAVTAVLATDSTVTSWFRPVESVMRSRGVFGGVSVAADL